MVLWFCLFHVSIIAGLFDPGVAILDVIWRMYLCSSGNIVMVRIQFVDKYYIPPINFSCPVENTHVPGVPKKTIPCLIACNVKSIKASSLK